MQPQVSNTFAVHYPEQLVETTSSCIGLGGQQNSVEDKYGTFVYLHRMRKYRVTYYLGSGFAIEGACMRGLINSNDSNGTRAAL